MESNWFLLRKAQIVEPRGPQSPGVSPANPQSLIAHSAMNSRQRVETALDHRSPDCVPLDLGASPVTGMHVSSVYQLRQALKLDEPGTPVKVVEPYQMLGEIATDLMDLLGVDVVGLGGTRTFFGFENKDW